MYVAFPCNLCVTVPEYAPAAKRMVDVCTMTVLPNSCPLDLCKRRGTLQIFGIAPQHLGGHPCPVLPADCLVMPSRTVSLKVFAVLNQHRALEACEGGTGTGRASAGGAAVPPGQGDLLQRGAGTATGAGGIGWTEPAAAESPTREQIASSSPTSSAEWEAPEEVPCVNNMALTTESLPAARWFLYPFKSNMLSTLA